MLPSYRGASSWQFTSSSATESYSRSLRCLHSMNVMQERGHQCNCRGESNAICDVHLMRALPDGFKIHSAVLLLKKDLMKAVRCCRSNWPITCSVMRNAMVATAPRAKPIQNMQAIPTCSQTESGSLGRSPPRLPACLWFTDRYRVARPWPPPSGRGLWLLVAGAAGNRAGGARPKQRIRSRCLGH